MSLPARFPLPDATPPTPIAATFDDITGELVITFVGDLDEGPIAIEPWLVEWMGNIWNVVEGVAGLNTVTLICEVTGNEGELAKVTYSPPPATIVGANGAPVAAFTLPMTAA